MLWPACSGSMWAAKAAEKADVGPAPTAECMSSSVLSRPPPPPAPVSGGGRWRRCADRISGESGSEWRGWLVSLLDCERVCSLVGDLAPVQTAALQQAN